MNTINTYLAHTDSLHTSDTSELMHVISEWYVAVPLFFGLLGVIVIVASRTLKLQTPHVINICLGLLFITGILVYQLVPILSIICISLGIFASLLIVLSSLSK